MWLNFPAKTKIFTRVVLEHILIYADTAKFIDDNLDNSIEAVKKLVRIPTVAAKGQGLSETADFVEKML